MTRPDIFSLKKQLVVYGSHHNNKVNVAIHMIFVPTIFWTGKIKCNLSYNSILMQALALVFTANTGPLVDVTGTPFSFLSGFGPNLSFVTVLGYLTYYAILDPIAAVSCFLLVGPSN